MSDKPNNISLRNWFAGMALSGFFANPNNDQDFNINFDAMADTVFSAADAMLEYAEEAND